MFFALRFSSYGWLSVLDNERIIILFTITVANFSPSSTLKKILWHFLLHRIFTFLCIKVLLSFPWFCYCLIPSTRF